MKKLYYTLDEATTCLNTDAVTLGEHGLLPMAYRWPERNDTQNTGYIIKEHINPNFVKVERYFSYITSTQFRKVVNAHRKKDKAILREMFDSLEELEKADEIIKQRNESAARLLVNKFIQNGGEPRHIYSDLNDIYVTAEAMSSYEANILTTETKQPEPEATHAAELWDVEEAVKRITHDGLLDTIDVMNQPDWIVKATYSHTAVTNFSVYLRARGFVELAIKLGKIKNPDSPANWIAWAEYKGYGTDHLESFTPTQKPGAYPEKHEKTNKEDCSYKEKPEHELRDLIKKTYQSLGNPKSNEVWKALRNDANLEGQKRNYDKDEIIQEMDRKMIYWSSRHGSERRMTLKTFNNFLSKLRNPKKESP